MDPPASGRAGEGAETHTHTPAAASGEGGEAGGRREGGRGGGEDAHARPAPSRRPRRAPRRPRPAGCRAGRGPAGSRSGAFCWRPAHRSEPRSSPPVPLPACPRSPLLQSRCHFSVKNLSPFHFAFKEPGFVAFSEWKHKAASGMAPPQASASSGLQKPRFSWEYRSSLSALEKLGGRASGYQSTKKKQILT